MLRNDVGVVVVQVRTVGNYARPCLTGALFDSLLSEGVARTYSLSLFIILSHILYKAHITLLLEPVPVHYVPPLLIFTLNYPGIYLLCEIRLLFQPIRLMLRECYITQRLLQRWIICCPSSL